DKFLVAMAIGLLAVAGEEIQKARAHVAGQVLDEDSDAVGLIIELQKKIVIAQLGEGAFGQALVSTQAAQSLLEISGANLVVHSNYAVAQIRHKSLAPLAPSQLLSRQRFGLYSAQSRGEWWGLSRKMFVGGNMHGLVFSELKKFVDYKLGPAAWNELLTSAGLGNKFYMATQEYPD